MNAPLANSGFVLLVALFTGCANHAASPDTSSHARGFAPLFPTNGAPQGWRVGAWNDVSKPGPDGAVWTVRDGVLYGSERGCWLMSEREYGDFILEYEFKLGPRGNSGCALRAPMNGDPAFDGLELQMADYRYNTNATAAELTGGLYRALAPSKQVYKPERWNSYRIELRGSRIVVTLNGEKIQDTDLSSYGDPVKRHDNTMAPPLKDRPRKGHIGFQELSRDGDHVMIRNARIRVLD
ncbi:MAG TPA: DUF1080 domain-containing protein [Candidatus Acidoferrum sp.]|nr:DUF1080 domain-containing protein [Candidatus Acidoferrum sp.]